MTIIHHSRWGDDALQRAVDAAGIALWSWNVDTDDFDMDERGFELWDVSPDEDLTFERLSEKIHPADRNRCGLPFSRRGPWSVRSRSIFER